MHVDSKIITFNLTNNSGALQFSSRGQWLRDQNTYCTSSVYKTQVIKNQGSKLEINKSPCFLLKVCNKIWNYTEKMFHCCV